MAKRPASDNVSGVKANGILRLFLFPGMFMQWLSYMLVGGRHYSSVAQRTRMARSPAITWIWSIVFWAIIIFVIVPMWKT